MSAPIRLSLSVRRSESVLVMSTNTQHVSVDRTVLKQLGYTTLHCCANSEKGLAYLENNAPGLMIITSELEDGAGVDFVRQVRTRFPERLVPSVMVTLRNRKEDVVTAISAGCAGYVLRPYSMDTFSRHIKAALESAMLDELDNDQLINARHLVSVASFDDAIEEFQELLPQETESERYFTMGTRALMDGKYGKAIIAFNKALALNTLYAEAYKGMAEAYKGKGDIERYRECLEQAAEIYANQQRHQDVKDLFAEILRVNPNAVNPYNNLGMRLRKEGDYKSALQMYFQAQELSPDDENLCFNIAKAFLYLDDQASAARYLDEALKINPGLTHAADLKARLERKR